MHSSAIKREWTAPFRRGSALGGRPGNHGGCGERSGGCERRARSSLLRRPTPGARPARRTSSVVAALAALAPRLVRLAHHDYSDRLLVAGLLAALERAVAERGAHPFVLHEGRRVAYAELDRLANRAAHALGALGVGKGDRVTLAMGDSVEDLVAPLRIPKIGGVLNPVEPAPGPRELGYHP